MVGRFTTRDGRALAYEEFGNPNGKPVFSLHGTPGSHRGPRPRGLRLYPRGIRLIGYDRPGYGDSDRCEGRRVADAAADVEDLADRLGIERFAVVGRSGGGPHALACAALLPERVTRVASLVTCAPRDLMGERWYDGMAERNIEWYRVAELGIDAYTEFVADDMNRKRADPESALPSSHADVPKADRAASSEYGIKSGLVDTYAEALRHGIGGWIDDNLAMISPWGFDPATLTTPVKLWHGADDVFSPVAHSTWLKQCIPHAELDIADGKAHLGAIEELPRLLLWLTEGLERADARS
ncbi:MAG TPA: alpha/beta hydrolase [Actinospica sp.]|jgi:pimeloyl-ACP methyl ester carboxylesterase|nr:alpha/beta hydrolase [Actinospica sp.]